MKRNLLFFEKLPPLSPTPQQTLFREVGPENTVFLKSSEELSAPLLETSLNVESDIAPPTWGLLLGQVLHQKAA